MLCVVRHGDRTPKQKIKVRVTMAQAPIIDLLMKYGSSKKRKEAKLKSPQQLQELMQHIEICISGDISGTEVSPPAAELPNGAPQPPADLEPWSPPPLWRRQP